MLNSRLMCFLAFLFILAGAPLASAQTEKIRIGSWNIEHLEFPQNRFGDAKGIAQNPQDLATHIKNSGVHVLALQELGDNLDPGRRGITLDATFAILNAGGEDWTYEITPNRETNDKSQLTGVAWNKKFVKKVGTVFRFSVKPNPQSGFNHWDRHPSAFKFSAGEGKTDFVVVSLHLKAGADGQNKKQRKEEMEALKNELAGFKTLFKEEDIILIGDTNVRSKEEEALKVITSAGFVDLNKNGLTTVPWGEAPFDHIFLPANQPEFAGAKMKRMITDNDQGRIKLSDHFLIYTDIKVMDDDDENVSFGGGEIPGIPVPPVEAPTPVVRILAALPDPIGLDEGSESVTLANGNPVAISLQGWKLKDKANNLFNLSGEIPPAATLSVTVRGNFTLNQGGDEIRLISPSGQVIHSVSYSAAQVKPGQFITFGN